MIARLAKPLALLTVLAALGCCAAPQPAAAINPVKPICTVIGLFSGLVGKLCTAAQHGKQLLAAGKKLLGGHLGGALKALSGSSAGKAVTTAAELAAIGAWVVGGAKFALQRNVGDRLGHDQAPARQHLVLELLLAHGGRLGAADAAVPVRRGDPGAGALGPVAARCARPSATCRWGCWRSRSRRR